jgi:hypothetical protein
MFGWIVRIILSVAAVITGWFVARDAANFGIIQMAVGLLLMTGFVAIAAFWKPLAAWLRKQD